MPPPPGNWGGYGAPGGYGPPPPGYGPRQSNGLPVAALVLGILGVLTFWFVLGGALGIVGLILGLIGLSRVRKGQATGKGMAIAGTVLSGLAIVLTSIVVVVAIVRVAPKLSQLQDCLNQAVTAQDRQGCRDQFTNNFLSPTP